MFFSDQILFFSVALVIAGFVMKWRRKKDSSLYRYPPSLPCLPLVGSLPFLRKPDQLFKFLYEKSRELGPIFTLRQGNKLMLVLNSRDAIEKAFIRNPTGFSNRSAFHLEDLANPDYKGVIFMRNSAEWKKQQQLSLSILREFGFSAKGIVESRVSREIEAMADYINCKNREAFDPLEMCTLATLNIITNMLFGRRRDYELGLSELCMHVHGWGDNFNLAFDFMPFLRFLPSHRKQVEGYKGAIKGIIECVKLEVTECLQNIDVPCFALSYIQKTGTNCDREQLNYLIRDLLGAGEETTASSLQWCLLALANYPEVQKRMRAEIDAVITGDRFPTLQDEANLHYVQATIMEIHRWRTLVPMSVFRETARDVVVDGYFIPVGTMVIPNLYAVHNDIDVWKDPDLFQPERFLDSNNNVVGKETIMPFSVGRRSCLGETLARAELFLILTSLVQRFLILPPEGQDKIDESLKLPVSIVCHPNKFQLRMIERK